MPIAVTIESENPQEFKSTLRTLLGMSVEATAEVGTLAAASDQDLLTELRARMATQGFKVVIAAGSAGDQASAEAPKAAATTEEKPKRGRGRPKKSEQQAAPAISTTPEDRVNPDDAAPAAVAPAVAIVPASTPAPSAPAPAPQVVATGAVPDFDGGAAAAPAITKEMVVGAVQAFFGKHEMEATLQLLQPFGGTKVSDIEPQHWPEVYRRATAGLG